MELFSDDSNGDEALARRRMQKLRHLSQQEASRKEQAEKRRTLTLLQEDPAERAESFYAAFQQQLESIRATLETKDGGNVASSSGLLEIAERIQQMEAEVADSAYFLPPHDIKEAQDALGKVKEELAAKRAVAARPKKFSFSSRRERRSVQEAGGGEPENGEGVGKEGDKEEVSGLLSGNTSSLKLIEGSNGTDVRVKESSSKSTSISVETSSSGIQFKGNGTLAAAEAGAVVVTDRVKHDIFLTVAEVDGHDLILERLKNCKIFVMGKTAAVFIHELEECQVFLGPVHGAAHIDHVVNSIVAVAAHQIRIHSSEGTDFYLRVRSQPIVEVTRAVRFAPYCFQYEGIDQQLEEAMLSEDNNFWREVKDFKWLRSTQSPNWSVLPEMERMAPVNGSLLNAAV